ncbi:Holliday junction endonuclease [Streptomyces sp. NPDC017936]|uniref:Holliday junction endonuclease n=1 Tax=Streptomyces sp. NPDC017936 TaxID=3365016 RepID=UPI003787BEB4
MGLDLSMTATGVAMPDGSTAVIKPRGEGDRRLLSIEERIGAALRVGRPDLAVIEDDPGVFKGAAAKAIPMVHATVRLTLMHAGVPYVLVNASTLKTYATGRHVADKTAMVVAALKRMGREFTDDNECDAAWLRAAGHAAYGAPVVEVPKAHTEALRKVAWPRLPGAAVALEPLPAKPARRRRKVAA